jgi:hypothetical protein
MFLELVCVEMPIHDDVGQLNERYLDKCLLVTAWGRLLCEGKECRIFILYVTTENRAVFMNKSSKIMTTAVATRFE